MRNPYKNQNYRFLLIKTALAQGYSEANTTHISQHSLTVATNSTKRSRDFKLASASRHFLFKALSRERDKEKETRPYQVPREELKQ